MSEQNPHHLQNFTKCKLEKYRFSPRFNNPHAEFRLTNYSLIVDLKSLLVKGGEGSVLSRHFPYFLWVQSFMGCWGHKTRAQLSGSMYLIWGDKEEEKYQISGMQRIKVR